MNCTNLFSNRLPLSMITTVALALACSANNDSPEQHDARAALRPGIQDSSKAYKGTPSPAEREFWQAVRVGDDAARAKAVAQLKADAASDPTNGYSAFLAGANSFMPPTELLIALATGGVFPEEQPFPAETRPLLTQAFSQLEDPLYLGFSGALLATVQAMSGDVELAAETQAKAVANNIPASAVTELNFELATGNLGKARDVMSRVLDYCNGYAISPTDPDLDAYVDKANAGSLVHRECYSGYHAMHATEGYMLTMGDLFAITGQPILAERYYVAARRATNYATWPLMALTERRIRGEQPVAEQDLLPVSACPTCHVNELR